MGRETFRTETVTYRALIRRSDMLLLERNLPNQMFVYLIECAAARASYDSDMARVAEYICASSATLLSCWIRSKRAALTFAVAPGARVPSRSCPLLHL